MTPVHESAASRCRRNRAGGRLAALLPAAAVLLATGAAAPAGAAVDGPPAPNPDARRYELVSPPDKGGGEVMRVPNMVQSSSDGNAVFFHSKGAFGGGAAGGLGIRAFFTQRGADAWRSTSVTPLTPPDIPQLLSATQVVRFGPDVRRIFVGGFSLPGDGGVAGSYNYGVDDLASGTREIVTRPQTPIDEQLDADAIAPVSAAADLRRATFLSTAHMADDAPDDGSRQLYKWSGGHAELISRRPDGTPATKAFAVPDLTYGVPTIAPADSLSRDGLRQVWTDEAMPQVFLAKEGQPNSVWVSQPENGPPPPVPVKAIVKAMSANGRQIVFVSTARLVPEDTNDHEDLYLYTDSDDPANDRNLTLLTPGSTALTGSKPYVLGITDDASLIYFVSEDSFDPDHPLEPGHTGIYLRRADRADHIELVASFGVNVREDNWIRDFSIPRTARVTPDGRHLLYTQYRHVDDNDNGTPELPRVLKLYDAGTGTTQCVSCRADGSLPQAHAELQSVDIASMAGAPYQESHNLSDDGRRVFFNTTDALVPQDVNGRMDVYQFDAETGRVALVSTGTGASAAYFGDASRDGSTAFFETRERLVDWDEDDALDLYAARVGGGLPDKPKPLEPCAGDACQGDTAPAPASGIPGSESYLGSGDLPPAKPAPRPVRVSTRRTVKGTSFVLTARVPSKGRLTASGSGLRTLRRTPARAGTLRLRVALTARARTTLRKRHRLVVRVRVRFVPASGRASVASAVVTLKA